MERKRKNNKVDFIICSDLHFTDKQPDCRVDDFWEAQIEKQKWIKQLSLDLNCPLLCGGDVFDVWKPNPIVISSFIENMPFTYTIAGQHDLPRHNLNYLNKSGITTLEKAEAIQIIGKPYGSNIKLVGFSYGSKLLNFRKFKDQPQIAIIHKLVDHPASGTTAKHLCKTIDSYDLIVTGDNHKTFTYVDKKTKTLLINPGSLLRFDADQAGHKPCVFLWGHERPLEFEQVFLPIRRRVISRSHLKKKEDKEKRMAIFVDKLNDSYEVGFKYEGNLETHIETNKPNSEVVAFIWESLETAKGINNDKKS